MWRLNPQLTACISSGRVILLDELRDRYFAVPTAAAQAVLDWLDANDGGIPPAALTKVLGELGRDGLSNQDRTRVQIPQPAASQPEGESVPVAAILSVASAVAVTWLGLRARRLSTILKERRLARGAHPALDAAQLSRRARAFSAARRWCPIPPNCLLDSLAFDRWMRSPGGVQLVFGVVGQPFEAHCWVQSDREILNDSYDRVSRFEPILSI